MVASRFGNGARVYLAALLTFIAIVFAMTEAEKTANDITWYPDEARLQKKPFDKAGMSALRMYVTCKTATMEFEKAAEDRNKCPKYEKTGAYRVDDDNIVFMGYSKDGSQGRLDYSVFNFKILHILEESKKEKGNFTFTVESIPSKTKIEITLKCPFESHYIMNKTIHFGGLKIFPLTLTSEDDKQKDSCSDVNPMTYDNTDKNERILELGKHFNRNLYEVYLGEDKNNIIASYNPLDNMVSYWYAYVKDWEAGTYADRVLAYRKPRNDIVTPLFLFGRPYVYGLAPTSGDVQGTGAEATEKLCAESLHYLEELEPFIIAAVVAFFMTIILIVVIAYLCLRVIPSAKAKIRARGDSAESIDQTLMKEVVGTEELAEVSARSSSECSKSKEGLHKTQSLSFDESKEKSDDEDDKKESKGSKKTSKGSKKTSKGSKKDSKKTSKASKGSKKESKRDSKKTSKTSKASKKESKKESKKASKATTDVLQSKKTKSGEKNTEAKPQTAVDKKTSANFTKDTREISKTLKDY